MTNTGRGAASVLGIPVSGMTRIPIGTRRRSVRFSHSGFGNNRGSLIDPRAAGSDPQGAAPSVPDDRGVKVGRAFRSPGGIQVRARDAKLWGQDGKGIREVLWPGTLL